MVAIVAVETVLIVLLIVLVAGLLRSHAEILRRLGPAGDAVAPPPKRERGPAETRAARAERQHARRRRGHARLRG